MKGLANSQWAWATPDRARAVSSFIFAIADTDVDCQMDFSVIRWER